MRDVPALLWAKAKETGSKTHLFIHNYHHPLRGVIAVLIFTSVIALIIVVLIGFSKAQKAREDTLEDINRKTDAQTMMICILMRAEPDMTPAERKEVNNWCEDEIERLQEDRNRDTSPSRIQSTTPPPTNINSTQSTGGGTEPAASTTQPEKKKT